MSAGAFSDPAVVEASKALVCVYVDCDWGKKNRELSERYGVRGYPTVLFCDPSGKPVERLRSHDPKDVAAQMRAFTANPAGPPREGPAPAMASLFEGDLGKAHLHAQKTSKLLLAFFHEDSPASYTVAEALKSKELEATLGRFVIWGGAYTRGSKVAEQLGVDRAPAIVVLDPALPNPPEKPLARIFGSRNARELERDLAPLAARRDPFEPKTGGPPPPAAKEDPAEELSNDEVDRRFIQATVKVAREWLKKGDRAKAIEILEDTVKTYPKHVETKEARKLLDELKAK
ncbi:MAG TPA: hypothetical protein VEJ18_15540 [Planctomycetota bacterium]|nr:hypothetical protein [Planctomycetota bacterium]